MLLAINIDLDDAKTAWVTVDDPLHKQGNSLTCFYSTDPVQISTQAQLERRNELSLQVTVLAAGFVIFG